MRATLAARRKAGVAALPAADHRRDDGRTSHLPRRRLLSTLEPKRADATLGQARSPEPSKRLRLRRTPGALAVTKAGDGSPGCATAPKRWSKLEEWEGWAPSLAPSAPAARPLTGYAAAYIVARRRTTSSSPWQASST